MPQYHFNTSSGILAVLAIALAVLMILLHVACCIGIHEDARRYSVKHEGTVLLGGMMWSLAGLLLGPAALGLYWLMHHSGLSSKPTPETAS